MFLGVGGENGFIRAGLASIDVIAKGRKLVTKTTRSYFCKIGINVLGLSRPNLLYASKDVRVGNLIYM